MSFSAIISSISTKQAIGFKGSAELKLELAGFIDLKSFGVYQVLPSCKVDFVQDH